MFSPSEKSSTRDFPLVALKIHARQPTPLCGISPTQFPSTRLNFPQHASNSLCAPRLPQFASAHSIVCLNMMPQQAGQTYLCWRSKCQFFHIYNYKCTRRKSFSGFALKKNFFIASLFTLIGFLILSNFQDILLISSKRLKFLILSIFPWGSCLLVPYCPVRTIGNSSVPGIFKLQYSTIGTIGTGPVHTTSTVCTTKIRS